MESSLLPKKEGGLDIRNLSTLNDADVLKLAWDSFSADSQWARYVHSCYNFLSTRNLRYRKSSIWPGFRYIASHFSQHSHWLIGDGSSVLFWKDKWLDTPILETLGVSDWSPFSDLLVANLIANNSWQLPPLFSQNFPNIAEKIANIPLTLTREPDMHIWEPSSSGDLSFSDGYESLRNILSLKD